MCGNCKEKKEAIAKRAAEKAAKNRPDKSALTKEGRKAKLLELMAKQKAMKQSKGR